MDLFEILTAGSDKLISHIHDGQDGGTQDYFDRPTDGTLKAAVIFNSSDETIHIVEVDESFDESLSDDVVDQWLSKAGSSAALPWFNLCLLIRNPIGSSNYFQLTSFSPLPYIIIVIFLFRAPVHFS